MSRGYNIAKNKISLASIRTYPVASKHSSYSSILKVDLAGICEVKLCIAIQAIVLMGNQDQLYNTNAFSTNLSAKIQTMRHFYDYLCLLA
jgi:hypothetical protein